MGGCLSCLGVAADQQDTSDTHPLLNEPYPPQHYGTLDSNSRVPQVDPEELRRQRDALERLCAATSEKLIDVTHATAYTNAPPVSRSKLARDYPRLFAEQFGGGDDEVSEMSGRYGGEAGPGHGGEEDAKLRPASAETLAEEDEMVRELSELLANHAKELAEWKIPEGLGGLSITFEELLGGEVGGRGYGAGNGKGKMIAA